MFEDPSGTGFHRPGSLLPGLSSTLPLQSLSGYTVFNGAIRGIKPTISIGKCQDSCWWYNPVAMNHPDTTPLETRGPDGAGADRPGSASTGRWLLRGCMASTLLAYWLLLSLALDPSRTIVFDAGGATYAGPLTWPARLFGMAGLDRAGVAAVYSVLMAVLVLSYAVILYLVRSDGRRSTTLLIVCGFAGFSLLFLLTPPLLSADLYSYTFYGRVMSVYHGNPYLVLPKSIPNDLVYPLVGWRDTASVYGPAFNVLSRAVCGLAGNSIQANVLGFKALSAACYAGCLPFVFSLARRLDPGRENLALAAVALNPLLLIHLVGGGHNEAVMALPVLAGFYLYRRARPSLGLMLVLLGVMVKATAVLFLLPYLVMYLRDVRGRPLARAGFALSSCVVVPFVFYLPFWAGARTFDATRQLFGTISFSSVPTLVTFWLSKLLGGLGLPGVSAEIVGSSLARTFFSLLFLAVTVLLLLRIRDYRAMVWSAAAIVLLYSLTSAYVLPWYVAAGLLVGAAAGWNPTTATLVATSLTFTMYRIPARHPVPDIAHRISPDARLSVPLLAILLLWLVLNWKTLFAARPLRPGGVPGA